MAVIHVLAYDIADDNVRVKVANRLLTAGYRLQRSVFQLEGSVESMATLVAAVTRLIEDDRDTLHVFRICEHCDVHRFAFGQGTVERPPTHWNV